MNTPIYDFVNSYRKKQPVRLHMPGHKGRSFLGFEEFDITEISGADSLYEAEGIIAESERNASLLFNSGATFYSTEGSSQCIKAMLYLLMSQQESQRRKPYIIATRNAHKAFLYGAALLDITIVWWDSSQRESLCSVNPDNKVLEEILMEREEKPIGVYITSPDYLGNLLAVKEIADICHKYKTKLAVDNAHGAYLHFLETPIHPLDLGADLCCDSAHKTLPVLTGGAYLHLGKRNKELWQKKVKQAMEIFGSTSPSYLTMISLDWCNRYLATGYKEKLKDCIQKICELKESLKQAGWRVENTEPLKLTIFLRHKYHKEKRNAEWLSKRLEEKGIVAEYADPEYLVFMFTPENKEEDFETLENIFKEIEKEKSFWEQEEQQILWTKKKTGEYLSPREAILSTCELIPIDRSVGRICANPVISCPPAIPIVVSGERIEAEDIPIFEFYGIENICVVKEQ